MDEFSRHQGPIEPTEPVNLVKERHGGHLDKADGGELPTEELDMTLHEAFNEAYTDKDGRVIVPDTIASLTDDERELIRNKREQQAAASQTRREEMAEEQAKHPHKKLWIGLGTAAAGVATVVGIGMGLSNSSNKTEPRVGISTSAPAVPGLEQSAAAQTTTVNPELYRGRVNPETLVNMTYEQLVASMQLTPANAPTPEAFARLVVQHLDTWANSGMTPQELEPFPPSNPQAYDNAMQAKYDAAFGEGLYGALKDSSEQARITAHNHRAFLGKYRLANATGQTNYNVKYVVENIQILAGGTNVGETNMVITVRMSDNLGEGINSPNLVPINQEGTLSVTMRDSNRDGVYDLYITGDTLHG